MYCPRCGQEQVSAELRFCSRCGLPLNLVAEVVAHNGTLPQLDEIYKSKGLLTRSNGLKFGLVWFLLFTFLLTPLIAVADGEEIVAITAILGFVGGILIMLFSFLFLKKEPKSTSTAELNQGLRESASYLRGSAGKGSLPPQQSQPASSYMPPAGSWQSDTNDLQPTSVTEETTKLLKEEES